MNKLREEAARRAREMQARARIPPPRKPAREAPRPEQPAPQPPAPAPSQEESPLGVFFQDKERTVILALLLLLSGEPLQALIFCILILVVQQVDGNFIAPRILGGATGMPGLGVLLAIIVGGNLFGVPGMVVGVPALAVLVTLLKQAVGAGLAARGIDEDGRPLQPPPDPKN